MYIIVPKKKNSIVPKKFVYNLKVTTILPEKEKSILKWQKRKYWMECIYMAYLTMSLHKAKMNQKEKEKTLLLILITFFVSSWVTTHVTVLIFSHVANSIFLTLVSCWIHHTMNNKLKREQENNYLDLKIWEMLA